MAFVNGWDFDIESNSGNDYYQYLISQLRSNFASDPSNKYSDMTIYLPPIVRQDSRSNLEWRRVYISKMEMVDVRKKEWSSECGGTPR